MFHLPILTDFRVGLNLEFTASSKFCIGICFTLVTCLSCLLGENIVLYHQILALAYTPDTKA